jgi:hypothetical protein
MPRNVPLLGSIEPTICSFSSKFRHRPDGFGARPGDLV